MGNGGVPVSWEVQLPGTNPFTYQPDTWGESSSFGYIRSVWEITSPDGSLPVGTPVVAQANLNIEGELVGYSNTVRAMLFLNTINDVSWLDQQEYLTFSVVDDFWLTPELSFEKSRDDSGTDIIDSSDSVNKDFQVGDIIVLEALLGTSSTLSNDGIERTIRADFENTLQTSLSIVTTGADLQLYGNPIPIPGGVWLLGSGLAGLLFVRRRKK